MTDTTETDDLWVPHSQSVRDRLEYDLEQIRQLTAGMSPEVALTYEAGTLVALTALDAMVARQKKLAVFEWLEDHAARNNADVVIHRGEDGPTSWSVGIHWGSEAEDSPMVGAATYGMGDTLTEALIEAAADCGWKP